MLHFVRHVMNVQCAVLVVHPVHSSEGTSSIAMEAMFSLVKLFCNGKGAHYIVWSATTRESAEGAIVWNTAQPARQGRYSC